MAGHHADIFRIRCNRVLCILRHGRVGVITCDLEPGASQGSQHSPRAAGWLQNVFHRKGHVGCKNTFEESYLLREIPGEGDVIDLRMVVEFELARLRLRDQLSLHSIDVSDCQKNVSKLYRASDLSKIVVSNRHHDMIHL